MHKLILLFTATLLFATCGKTPEPTPPAPSGDTYFPSATGTWETTTPTSLSWNVSELDNLRSLLEEGDTRAFIVLVKGKIVIEEYFGKNLLNILPFTENTNWYWASAGKTLTGFAIGKAVEEGHLTLSEPTSQYLGTGWTSLTTEQEEQITIRHQLTMTTGLDDTIDNSNTSPDKLVFKATPGTRWAYHNAPYTLLQEVVTQAAGQPFEQYLKSRLTDEIGMKGEWRTVGNNHIYFSTARDMARFGLLILNDGKWKEKRLINHEYLSEATSPSQGINNSYGYLWWLNGQSTYMLPGTQTIFSGSLIPNAPEDMYCGLGANGQYLCIIPSKEMVMIRMGEDPDNSLAPIAFLNDIWEIMGKVL